MGCILSSCNDFSVDEESDNMKWIRYHNQIEQELMKTHPYYCYSVTI
jgi:hypothetical protein